MIFKPDDITEFKAALTVAAEFNMNAIRSSIINKGQDELLIPKGLGKELFSLLDAAYNSSDDMDARYQAILGKCQYIVAHYAYLRYLPQAQVLISKEGVRITKSETSSTAFQWQIDQLAAELSTSAYEGLEWLLQYLEENSGDYPEWVSSPAYSLHMEGFIHSAKDFDYYVLINESRRTFMAMRYIQRRIETDVIKGTFCGGLFDEIITQLQAGTLSAENAALMPFIKQAVANLTVADAIIELPVIVTHAGIAINDGTRDQRLDNTDVTTRMTRRDQCLSIGNAAVAKLSEYLYANIDDYPLFSASTCYIAPPEDSTEYNGSAYDTTGFTFI